MERATIKDTDSQKDAFTLNHETVVNVLEQLYACGIRDLCICSGARNSPFIPVIKKCSAFNCYYCFEERSSGFFAVGKARQANRPVAVITTSGTAAGELLPATMEAYYSGVPLVLVTADRPSRFRGSGAPQSAEQQNLFGVYTPFRIEAGEGSAVDLSTWEQNAPAHVNVCLEEPKLGKSDLVPFLKQTTRSQEQRSSPVLALKELKNFIESSRCLQVIVGALPKECQEAAVQFLVKLGAPVYVEAPSGIREDKRIQHLVTPVIEQFWDRSNLAKYPIDALLRIGSVPTARIWRDVEEFQGKIRVCSISRLPFSGVTFPSPVLMPMKEILEEGVFSLTNCSSRQRWIETNQQLQWEREEAYLSDRLTEPALIHQLSLKIPSHAFVYLGNSLPVREWDLAATYKQRGFTVAASRGLNGIDGQLSTFLGMCDPQKPNWAIVGDLTTLYDLSAPWFLQQMQEASITIVVVNNGGGKIFEGMFPDEEIQNKHCYTFSHLAAFWGIKYERWETIPDDVEYNGARLVELDVTNVLA